jgi:hypothetical protein
MGDLPHAEDNFRHASILDVHDAEALNLMALMDMRQNRLDDAYKIQRRGARRPDEPRQYLCSPRFSKNESNFRGA